MKQNIKILIAFLHGILLLLGLWFITNSSFTSRADEAILDKINTFKQSINGNQLHYDHDFIFINVSRDQKLLPDPMDYGDVSITDRNKLAQFFKILADNGNQHYFTLCDIFFEHSTDDDTVLVKQIHRCTKQLFPYHINEDNIQKPVIEVPLGLSTFVTYTGNFSKFRLVYNDSLKTTPLILLNTLDKKNYHDGFPNFQTVLPQYYIQLPDLISKKKYPYFNLGELLLLSETDSFYYEFLKGRFIVIGNFDTDIHYSPAGKIAGPLILVNLYLTLRNGDGVSWWWILFMTVSLSGISYLLFFKKIKAPEIKKYLWADMLMQLFVNKYISFSGICLLVIICSAFIFNVQPNISPLLLYLLIVNFFINFYNKNYKKEK